MVDLGLVHDWDPEDFDDTLSSYKLFSALELRGDKSVQVRLHFIVDCGSRREYVKRTMQWMMGENGMLEEGNGHRTLPRSAM